MTPLQKLLSVFLLFCLQGYSQGPPALPDSIQTKVAAIRTIDDVWALIDLNKKLIYNEPPVGSRLAHVLAKVSQKKGWNETAHKACTIIGIYHQNRGEYDSAHFYYMKGWTVSERANNPRMMAESENNLGVLAKRQNLFDSSLHCYQRALKLAMQMNDSTLTGMYYSNIGNVLTEQEKYKESLDQHLKSLVIREKLGDEDQLAASYNNIGNVYLHIDQPEKAVEYFLKCYAIRERSGNKMQRMIICLNTGSVYYDLKQYDRSLEFHEKALALAEELGNNHQILRTYQNLSYIYEKMGDPRAALEYSLKTFPLHEQLGITKELIQSYFRTSDLFFRQGRKKEAMTYAQRAYQLTDSVGGFYEKKEAALMLANLYEDRGEYQKALLYFQAHGEYSDSLQRERYNSDLDELREKYESDKKEEQIRTQQVALEHQSLLTQRSSMQRNFLVVVAVMVTVILILAIRIYRTRLKAKELVYQKSKEYEALRSNFFANISHEFRTPLTLITGPLQQMAEEQTYDPVVLQTVIRNTGRLERLIAQMLELSKLEAGKSVVHEEPADLHLLVRAVASAFEIEASTRSIHYEVTVPEEELLVTIDRDKIEKIIYNLLSNAIKFTPDGGHVTCTFSSDHAGFRLEVSDTGPGIADDQLPMIFERFHRAWAEGDHQFEGSGIGLALVKELVELLGGTIAVKSKEGEGTVFHVFIPVTYTTESIQTEVPAFQSTPTTDIREIANVNNIVQMTRPQVLVVDDNADMRNYVATCLGLSYEILHAGDGVEGIENAERHIPDIIISDLMMPVMDGMDFCRHIRAANKTSHIPFILLTARAEEESKIKGLGLGADDYLVKPFNRAELTHKVQNILERIKDTQKKLRLQFFAEPQPEEVLSEDEAFLLRLRNFIEENLAEDDLSVEALSREIALSRVQLYRKVQSLTGISVNELIRSIRLKKAASLLDQKWGSVSQVAYEVGFNNLSYFARCFREAYGKTPSQYLNREETSS